MSTYRSYMICGLQGPYACAVHDRDDHVACTTVHEENWSFPGLSEANLHILKPRAFSLKLAKSAQGFPNLDNNSQGHPTCFKSP
jgi:hypothetical protein